MRLIAAQNGKLLTLDANSPSPGGAGEGKIFSSGLAEWDAIAPGGGFARGAVHELLTDSADAAPSFIAMLLSLAASRRVRLGGRVASDTHTPDASTVALSICTTEREFGSGGAKGYSHGWSEAQPVDKWNQERCPGGAKEAAFAPKASTAPSGQNVMNLSRGLRFAPPLATILGSSGASWCTTGITIWCDPQRQLYPPALASYGFPLDQLYLLRPDSTNPKDLTWAIAESLRCKGVSAVVAAPPHLSRIEARRLQLAAERGGGIGILLRQVGRESVHHAAASRWLVRPAPGSRTSQRWTIQLLHGHGGQVGKTLGLELSRETHHVHPFTPVADRQVAKKPALRAS